MKLTKDLENIILDHGTGGLLSQDLISSIITAKTRRCSPWKKWRIVPFLR